MPVRLAVITQSRARIGGVEAYLEALLPALAARHDVLFWSASGEVTARGAIALPAGMTALTCDGVAADPLQALRAWRPDLLFAHGLDDAVLEARVLDIAPAAIVRHTYHGTCISSTKTMRRPGVRQCDRAFGAACLALYFPRQCGGSNPLTMARLYRAQSARLLSLKRGAAVITLSAHMAQDAVKNGLPPDRVHVVPPFVSTTGSARLPNDSDGSLRLLFIGRLEPLKGVMGLLDALPVVSRGAGVPVRLVVAGDGTERAVLESHARLLRAANPRIQIEFAGWQAEAGRARLLAGTDLLVVPSVWPEPFGLVGLEAAAAGVPAVAFRAGGIPEWLHDDENGCLAAAEGARPQALADAIIRCARSPENLTRLSAGAVRSAAAWTLDSHLTKLQHVFDSVLAQTVARRAC